MGRADRCGARSDGVGEFGEGRGDPMPQVDIDTEFVVAADGDIWTKACPALITRAERSRFNPRIGRSRDFRRP